MKIITYIYFDVNKKIIILCPTLFNQSMHKVRTLIRKWRKSKGLSQENMAVDLGISQTAYTNLENGHTQMTVERLILIARLLDKDIVDFFIDLQKETVTQDNDLIGDDMNHKLHKRIALLKEEINSIERLIDDNHDDTH